MRSAHTKTCISIAILLAFCACAFALDPSLDVSQYAHTAWKISDGFPKGIVNKIAQTPDGYLWIGTEFGLFRFDGVRAVPWQPPSGEHLPGNNVRGLLAAHDGTLWIGTLEGLASWKDGKLKQYSELAGRGVTQIQEDRDGTVWVAGFLLPTARLCAIRSGGVQCYGDDGRFGISASPLYEDGRGNLWVGTTTGLWRWKPGPPKFYPIPGPTPNPRGLIEGDNGAILISTRQGVRQLIDGEVEPYPLPGATVPFNPGSILRDRNGGLWIGTYSGLLHVHQGRTDAFTEGDGLSGDAINTLFEDREGNIWVASLNGIDRFRDFAVPTISVKQGLSNAAVGSVLAVNDGSLWIGTLDGLDRWKNGEFTIYRKRSVRTAAPLGVGGAVRQIIGSGLPDDGVDSLYQDEAGRVWLSTVRGMAYFENGSFIPVQGLPGGYVHSIAGDRSGNLWIANQNEGLFHLLGAKVVEQIAWARLGGKDVPMSMLADPVKGGLWLGYFHGGLVYFKDGQVRARYAAGDGLGEGRVNQLRLGSRGSLWAATAGGLSRIKDGKVATLTSKNGLPCDAVHWSIEDDDQTVWLYTACGLVRIPRSELDSWVSDPMRMIQSTVLDSADGVRNAASPSVYSPPIAKSEDGRFRFATYNGVSVIDPRHLPVNKLPPPVHVEEIVADDKTYDAASPGTQGLRLPPRVHNLEIHYTALSLVAPEKVRFRIKLEGQDPEWRELADRHENYTNLGPGHYRFRVKACNNSGVWNEEGAALQFVIPPAWYQTNWFRAACVAAFLAMIWGIYELRVRQLAAQFNMRLEERVAERTRVARDLHDTLLQSFQALLPSLQAGINMLAARPADARKVLEDTADHASQAIAEGRDAVQGLRMSTVEKNDLAVAIRTIGEELASAASSEPSPNFNVVVEGASRNLHPILRDEVYRLATEALRNAFRHAAAQNIEVEIRYDDKYFRLRVRDDGKGIPSNVLSGDGPEGHYGLPGMRERAKLVGGKLAIWTELDGGTEIELNIPGARAYVESTRPFWHFGKRSATETDEKEPIERE